MKIKKTITLSLIIVVFSSCLKNLIVQDYYYKTNSYNNIFIYKYQSNNDKTDFQYWVIQADTLKKEITTKRYNKDRVQIDEIIE